MRCARLIISQATTKTNQDNMIRRPITLAQNVLQNISDFIDRYGAGAIALIILIELVWAASVAIPVLFVLSSLIDLSKHWMAILPGFMGLITLLLAMALGVFVAYQPSTYVARWRENVLAKVAPRHP